MARTSLNAAEVAAAFEKLLIQGEQPTAEKIHALLGKGSVDQIQKHIQQIAEQSRLDLTPAETREPAEIHNHNTFVATESPQFPNEAPTTPPEPSNPAEPQNPLPPDVPFETPTDAAMAHNNNGQNKRNNFKRERFNNRHSNGQPHGHSNKQPEFEEVVEVPLEQLSEETLAVKIRRLESMLMKEQMRREVAERIMVETKDYAESIKEQVSQRINDLRQNMDLVLEQLKNQLREQKQGFDQDLKYYQEQLSKANEKVASLMK